MKWIHQAWSAQEQGIRMCCGRCCFIKQASVLHQASHTTHSKETMCKGHWRKSCDRTDKRAKSVARRDIYWQSYTCVCVCVQQEAEALRQCEVEVRPRRHGCGIVTCALTHASCSSPRRQRTSWLWWVLTSVTFGCCQDPLTETGLFFFVVFFFVFLEKVLLCCTQAEHGRTIDETILPLQL